jgi:hypothetical protein
MSPTSEPISNEICVSGHLDQQWAAAFAGSNVLHEFTAVRTPITILAGSICDQSAPGNLRVAGGK